jgi:hypothetical protein
MVARGASGRRQEWQRTPAEVRRTLRGEGVRCRVRRRTPRGTLRAGPDHLEFAAAPRAHHAARSPVDGLASVATRAHGVAVAPVRGDPHRVARPGHDAPLTRRPSITCRNAAGTSSERPPRTSTTGCSGSRRVMGYHAPRRSLRLRSARNRAHFPAIPTACQLPPRGARCPRSGMARHPPRAKDTPCDPRRRALAHRRLGVAPRALGRSERSRVRP